MLKAFRKNGEKGFTLIELMIVIAIIGILAAIAIPQFMTYRQKGYNASAQSDVKQAFTAAQAYFTDAPNGTVSLAILKTAGYTQTANVETTVNDGTQSGLEIVTTHTSGTSDYTIDSAGTITPSAK